MPALRHARIVLGLVGLLSASVPLAAQAPSTADRDVVAAVQQIFDAMARCDAAGVRARTLPDGRLFRLTPGSGQPPTSTTLAAFAAQFDTCPRKLLERMWAPQVRVHKGIASVWAPYDFWADGAFSHCGIDSFDLADTADGWKLAGGIYTVERDGCGASPLGAPTFK